MTNARGAVTITSTTARNSKADVARMVADAEKYASADAALKQKVEARRMLEDLIFDLMDEESGASGKQQKAASEADEWLRSEFESLSVDQIHTKYKGLKAVA